MTGIQVIEGVKVRRVSTCCVCGAEGEPLYVGLRDRLFSVPGEWNMSRCAQTRCGLLWLDPMPLEAEVPKLYPAEYLTHVDLPDPLGSSRPRGVLPRAYRSVVEGYLAATYGYGSGSRMRKLIGRLLYLHPVRRAKHDLLVMYVPARPGGRLLDVGCGNGELLARMRGFGWYVEGVDVDPVSVAIARDRGLSVRLGSLQAQEYPPASFDVVTMNHVIEHVPDPLDVLMECHRILTPGGLLVIETPNAGSWGHRRFGAAWVALEPPRHLHVFTVPALRTLVRRAGFEDMRMRTTLALAGFVFAMSRAIRRFGRFDPTRDKSRAATRRANALRLAEWLLLNGNRALGEDIALIARR